MRFRITATNVALAALLFVPASMDLVAAPEATKVAPKPPITVVNLDELRTVRVESRASLLHLGSLDSFDKTPSGTKAAKLVVDAIEKKNPDLAREAWKLYEEIIPKENFSGEYTTIQWVCEYLVGTPAEQMELLKDPFVARFHKAIAEADYAPLRDYLKYKYRLTERKNDAETIRKQRFYEDLILFNNPRRERWEQSSKILEALKIKPGETIADIGAGPGYWTFKFANLVGPNGLVYALDTNDMHYEYQAGIIKDLDIKNVKWVRTPGENLGLPEGTKLDMAFMNSLYHVLYCGWDESMRRSLMDSIRNNLKPDGRLVIVDKGLVHDRTLPYQGPYIAKELVVAQLEHMGFVLTGAHLFDPQPYVLEFKVGEAPPRKISNEPGVINITDANSLCTGPPANYTPDGRTVARLVYEALDKKDPEAARKAMEMFKELIPKANVGNDYYSLNWYCEYIAASPEEKKAMIKDPMVAHFFTSMGGDDFSFMKKYVYNQYLLNLSDKDVEDVAGSDPNKLRAPDVDEDTLQGWNDIIVLHNPIRDQWDKTEKVLDFMKIKPGDKIADLGCGPGYWSFKFSKRVGKDGKVYGLEIADEALDKVRQAAAKPELGLENIIPYKTKPNDVMLPEGSVDMFFICSMWHAVYMRDLEFVQDQLLTSAIKAVKKGGRIVVIDNDLPQGETPIFDGPRIDRRLIVEQFKRYGLKLVDSAQFIPQRYVLVFEKP